MPRAVWNGTVLAESDDTVVVEKRRAARIRDRVAFWHGVEVEG